MLYLPIDDPLIYVGGTLVFNYITMIIKLRICGNALIKTSTELGQRRDVPRIV